MLHGTARGHTPINMVENLKRLNFEVLVRVFHSPETDILKMLQGGRLTPRTSVHLACIPGFLFWQN